MPRIDRLCRAAVLLAATVVCAAAGAQTATSGAQSGSAAEAATRTAPKSAPRIGLALSGGGARGIAHVGVLKVLDEMRIPISCVTGTSMGAIVGGTFASGRTVADMEQAVLDADWAEIFRDAPPRKEIAVRRKIDDYKTLFKPEFGVKDGSLALPKGVLAGVSIESFFRQLAMPAFGIGNFDQLPIPFRAMATDIETGESVVLGKGSVAQAMRASMSVPGAIAPVEIDGRLLVDGGIANNLPIDEARKLCGEVIIAVNISTPPLRRDQITSAVSVTAQLINFLGKQTVDEQLKSLDTKDVLIAPDLGDISSSSFNRVKDAIKVGEDATRAMAGQLARYSLPPEQYAAVRGRQIAEGRALGSVDEIRVEGLKRTNPAVAEALIESKPGEPLTEAKLGADLRRIYGTGDFESISYRIVGGPGGPRALLIEPVEKSWGPDYLRFGLGLASDFSGDSQFNALVQYRKTWMNHLGAEWTTQVQVGQNTYLSTEFFQPVNEAGKWFVAPNFYVGQQTRGVFENEDKVADYLTSVTQGGLDGGAVLGTWGQLRAGYVMSRVHARVETGSPLLPSVHETTAGLRAGVFIDQTDSAWFARSGFGLSGTAYFAMESLGSEVSYNRVEATARVAQSWGPHTLNLAASGGSSLGSDMPAYESFSLGGPLHLSAYRINEFAGRQYTFGRLVYYYRAVPLPDLLGSGIYAGASAEVGRISDRVGALSTPGTVWSSSVFLSADTFLGPAYFGVGVGAGRWSLYLLLGVP
ncbi:MAG TPA: patatin-like phospholipase family protein [Burkholderiaceae bacterium]|nr:patatin-like phospholipase family protein [Burkholderiaceae bacterium]